MREVLSADKSPHRSELSALRDHRAAIVRELAELESGAGYRLVPTPANDPYIALVSLATGRAVGRFNKVELAMVIGHDSSKCERCRPRLILV